MNNEQNLPTSPYISDLALVSFEIKKKKKHMHVFEGCLQHYTDVRSNVMSDLTDLEVVPVVAVEVGCFL